MIRLSDCTRDPKLKAIFDNGLDGSPVLILAPKPVKPSPARELEVA